MADITDPCILGLDFLIANNCRVDIANAVPQMPSVEVPMVKKGTSSSPHCWRVVVEDEITIPPKCEAIIFGKRGDEVETENDIGRWASVGPVNNATVVHGLLVAWTLVDLRMDKLPVRVMNVSDKQRKLKTGTIVGLCEPVSNVRRVYVDGTDGPVCDTTSTAVPVLTKSGELKRLSEAPTYEAFKRLQ